MYSVRFRQIYLSQKENYIKKQQFYAIKSCFFLHKLPPTLEMKYSIRIYESNVNAFTLNNSGHSIREKNENLLRSVAKI